jgi:hypothetical protein
MPNYSQPDFRVPITDPAVTVTGSVNAALPLPNTIAPYVQPGTANPPTLPPGTLSGPMGRSQNGPFG